MGWFTPEISEGFPETDQDRLAYAEAERIFSEAAYDLAVKNLRDYNDTHRQGTFAYKNGDITRIQTFCNDAVRKRLEAEVRSAYDRRNKALSERANLMMKTGMIR
jgi:hypothetical protein